MRETEVNPVAKALWFIESHFAGEVTLAEISRIAGYPDGGARRRLRVA